MSSSSSGSDSEAVSTSAPHKVKGKEKQRQKRGAVRTALGKNEGVDPDWAYKVPSGATLLNVEEEAKEFDWNSLEIEDNEVWIMRVPEGVSVFTFRKIHTH
jgi:hypothetical protein